MHASLSALSVRRATSLLVLLWAIWFAAGPSAAQTNPPANKPSTPSRSATAAPQQEKAADATPQVPARLELLETHYRFEADGSSRKEVHTIVKINSELGVRQFAHLNFDYNRAFESVEIPLVRVTHASGGTADVLPSAITDNPNPAVADAPAYQDVRVKSVRILGLEPSDTLEYRVITTVLHHPLAPDFWLRHSFDRSGVVSREVFEIDLPSARNATVHVNPATPGKRENSGEGAAARDIYRWQWPIAGRQSETDKKDAQSQDAGNAEPDIAISTTSWEGLSIELDTLLMEGRKGLAQMRAGGDEYLHTLEVTPEVSAKARELTAAATSPTEKLRSVYEFVAQKITTVDLPLGATGFVGRPAGEVFSSGYASPEDKYVTFATMAAALGFETSAALTGYCNDKGTPGVSGFNHMLIAAGDGGKKYWLDPSLEVAPFGMVSPIPQKCVFMLNRNFMASHPSGHEWEKFERVLPFAATQKVNVEASLDGEGKLTAKVKYVMRGDNELLLRITFHQTAREKWKSLAQLLSLSDGFRGEIKSVSASDPYATREPFTVEYEISQEKFVDWAKKPVRMPAILPLVGLPDPPAAVGAAIELGTPLEVDTEATLKLPPGFVAQTPTGTSVARDYATFASKYGSDAAGGSADGITLSASRHINFIARELSGDRGADYLAFLRAVQNDEAQTFVITGAAEKATPAAEKAAPAKP